MKVEKQEFNGYYISYGYYQGNKLIFHKEDGPAIEYINGNKAWYIHGKLHREDGPAREGFNGFNFWYLEGNIIKEKDFEEALRVYKVSKVCK
jgi:hypothetical protein